MPQHQVSMDWTHQNPVRIQFGDGTATSFNPEIHGFSRALIVTCRTFADSQVLSCLLNKFGRHSVRLLANVKSHPAVETVNSAIREIGDDHFDCIIAIGGGSVIDTAKILSLAFSGSFHTVQELLKHKTGDFNKHPNALPLVAIPTTAGTGSEVTPFATVWDYENGVKKSLDTPLLFPYMAILDPSLLSSLSYEQTLFGALDAIAHALDSLWNRNRTPISEIHALASVSLMNRHLPLLLADLNALERRRQIQLAAMLAGLAISQTHTSIAHAVSYTLTLRHGVPHGLACGWLLAEILETIDLGQLLTRDRGEFDSLKDMLFSLPIKKLLTSYLDPGLLKLRLEDCRQYPERFDNFVADGPAILSCLAKKV